MAEANPNVMQMVESELKKNPDISNKELLDKARGIDKNVEKLTARQFNATYPLQVKRSMKPARKRTGGKRGKAAGGKGARGGRGRGAPAGGGTGSKRGRQAGDGSRDQVRQVLFELARDVAEGDRGTLVKVVAGIDRYVDRILKATA